MVVEIEIRRKPRPDLGLGDDGELPTRTADGVGWIITCARCQRSRVMGCDEIMDGSWARFPSCEAPAASGRKD